MRKAQSGFTLIELVVVIVILGILAATAAPRFINLTADANIASLEGLASAVKSSSNMVHAKSQINGIAGEADSSLDIDRDGTDDLDTVYGYPSANRTTGIANVLDIEQEWLYGDQFGGGELYITHSSFSGESGITNNNIKIRSHNCYLTYIPPQAEGESYTVSFTTTGC